MQTYNGKATASMVLGIISVALALFATYIYPAVAGLICGIIGLVLAIQIRKAGQTEGFELSGTAKAGFVLNVISVALNALMFLACVACVGLVGGILGSAASGF